MARAMAAIAGNGEVRVEKVDKISYVYDAVRPPVCAARGPAMVTKKLAAANVASPEDIDEYIAKKKREFVLGL